MHEQVLDVGLVVSWRKWIPVAGHIQKDIVRVINAIWIKIDICSLTEMWSQAGLRRYGGAGRNHSDEALRHLIVSSHLRPDKVLRDGHDPIGLIVAQHTHQRERQQEKQ